MWGVGGGGGGERVKVWPCAPTQKTKEAVDHCQNKKNVKAVATHHCIATSILCNCCFNSCVEQSQDQEDREIHSQLTWLSIHRHQNEDQEDTERYTTDLAVNTQTHQHEEGQEDREIHNWPGCQYTDTPEWRRSGRQRDTQLTWLSIHRHPRMKKTRKTERYTTDLAVNTQTPQNEEDQEDRYTTDLAVNTQTPQNEEDQEDREIHNWPGCQYTDTPAWGRPGRHRETHSQPTWLSIHRHTSMRKTRKTQRDTQSTDLAVNTQTHQHEEDQEDTERHTVNRPGCQYPDTPAWRRSGRQRDTVNQPASQYSGRPAWRRRGRQRNTHLTDLAVNTQADQHEEEEEDRETHT